MPTTSQPIFAQGFDPNGVPRVWGDGDTEAEALTNARTAAIEYITRRPDTGPMIDWRFETAA